MAERKTAIITGSGTGIGAATAERLAERGHNVVINYSRSEEEAHETAKRCRAFDVDALVVKADVTQDEDCRALAHAALETWGRIDILVNNAGGTRTVPHGDLEELTADDFQWLNLLNVVGPFQMIRAVTPAMKKQGRGSIVNVSSIAGVTGVGSSIAYCASKGAVNTMTLSMARALAPEIRINAVCPGFVGTRWFSAKMDQESYDGLVRMMEDTTPLKQAGTPEGVAEAVVFLAMEGSNWITGETLLTDAGMHLNLTPFSMR